MASHWLFIKRGTEKFVTSGGIFFDSACENPPYYIVICYTNEYAILMRYTEYTSCTSLNITSYRRLFKREKKSQSTGYLVFFGGSNLLPAGRSGV